MKNSLTIITFVLISLNAMGQNFIYKGDKQYQATNTWTFECENYFWHGDLEVQIAKSTTGGYLRLSVNVPPSGIYSISGPAYIYLTDGSMITCSDKGIKDNVDQQAVALYSFTQAEMDRLKTLDIQKIRFTLKNNVSSPFEKNSNNYTGKNTKKEANYYQTSYEVTSLFL